MTLIAYLLTLLLATSATRARSTNQTISWFPCPPSASINTTTDGGVPLTCGSLTVPLDYTKPNSTQTLQLQLTKITATKQPSKGSIILQPGGPGAPGAQVFEEGPAETALLLSGGSYDIVAFNPRGTGQTLPFSCFASDEERQTAALLTPVSIGGSDVALGQVWAAKETVAQLCLENSNGVGELIGTAFTARDMMQIVDALDEDGMLRYWGFSYGTVLGMTAAAMFPDRIDKMVLDGNENWADYYAGNGLGVILDMDTVLAGFFQGCIESSETCPLATNDTSAKDLEHRFANLLQDLRNHPIPAPTGLASGTLIIDYDYVQNFLYSLMYFPAAWPYGAAALADLFEGNTTGFLSNAALAGGGIGLSIADPDQYNPDALQGIQCSDSSIRAQAPGQLAAMLNQTIAQSRYLGTLQVVFPLLTCAAWRMRAKEVYSGSFNDIKTSAPLLFVGNTADGLTPLINAHNASLAFEGSVVLQNDGYGHTSIASPSLCTAKHIQEYFVDGTLPPPGTICQHSYKTFDTPPSYLEVLGLVAALGPIANITEGTFGKK